MFSFHALLQSYIYLFPFSFTAHLLNLHIRFLPLLFSYSIVNPTHIYTSSLSPNILKPYIYFFPYFISQIIHESYIILFLFSFPTHSSTLHIFILLLFPQTFSNHIYSFFLFSFPEHSWILFLFLFLTHSSTLHLFIPLLFPQSVINVTSSIFLFSFTVRSLTLLQINSSFLSPHEPYISFFSFFFPRLFIKLSSNLFYRIFLMSNFDFTFFNFF